jgi:multidrug transporter EmrE-like cation transporter
MAAAGGIDQSLRNVRVIHCAFMVAVCLYVYVPFAVPNTPAEVAPGVYGGIALISLLVAVAVFVIQKKMIASSAGKLRIAPDDAAALMKWRKGSILSCVFTLTIALFGVAFWFLGADWMHVAPFFVVAAGILIVTFPKRP